MSDFDAEEIAGFIEDLSGASRRKRQDAAHKVALIAKEEPEAVASYVEALIDALERPEAQTRWEVLTALTQLVPEHADEVAPACEGAEQSLFDEDSATVRLAAFVFLAKYGASSPERSDETWPLLDEAIQCYHGDAEYHDMLVALLDMAQGNISKATKKALSDRVSFDANRGSGYIKTYSSQILETLG